VVGRPHRELGEVVHAFVVARTPLDVSGLREHLAAMGVARFKWPESAALVNEIPLSGPGKVDRRRLRERAARLG